MRKISSAHIADNDELRSFYIFENIIKNGDNKNNYFGNFKEIPKQIFQYWDEKNIPDDVKQVMDSWTKSGIRRIVYDKFSAREFISKHGDEEQVSAFDMCTHPAMRADFF